MSAYTRFDINSDLNTLTLYEFSIMLSVLLSIHYKESPFYLEQSLQSIWDDQHRKPDQIVLVKDGHLTVDLEDKIHWWKEKLGNVLDIVALRQNVGLGAALNEGLMLCKHELVARMDTDDVALPARFTKQVAFMQTNPDIVASSGLVEEWDAEFRKCLSVRHLPNDPIRLAIFAKHRSPLSHPAVIFRKSAVLAVGGYPPLRKAQDYALWSRLLIENKKLANLPDTLLRMRAGEGMMNRRGWHYFRQEYYLLCYQRHIGFFSLSDFYVNIILKAMLRLSPNIIKSLVYRFIRPKL